MCFGYCSSSPFLSPWLNSRVWFHAVQLPAPSAPPRPVLFVCLIVCWNELTVCLLVYQLSASTFHLLSFFCERCAVEKCFSPCSWMFFGFPLSFFHRLNSFFSVFEWCSNIHTVFWLEWKHLFLSEGAIETACSFSKRCVKATSVPGFCFTLVAFVLWSFMGRNISHEYVWSLWCSFFSPSFFLFKNWKSKNWRIRRSSSQFCGCFCF